MKKLALFSIVALGQFWANSAQSACFAVYDAKNNVIYQNTESPVDMSLPIGDAVKAAHGPGAALVFSPDSEHCHPILDNPKDRLPEARAPEKLPAEAPARLRTSVVPTETAAAFVPQAAPAPAPYDAGNAPGADERVSTGPRASSSWFNLGGGKTSRRRR